MRTKSEPSLATIQHFRFTFLALQQFSYQHKPSYFIFNSFACWKIKPPFQNSLDKVKGNTFMSQKTWPIRSLIELKNVFAAAGGRVVALTGGAGQVVEANHLACHQLDTPVKSN